MSGELSARIAAPSRVQTRGNGNDPRQAAMGMFFGYQAAEPFTLQETITVWYVAGTLTGDSIPAGNQARIWDTDQATTDSANVVALNNLTTFYKVFTIPGSLQLYAAAQQDYPAIVAALSVIPLWDLFGRNWRRSQLLPIVARCLAATPTIRLAASGLQGPQGMCLGTDGLVYFSDGNVAFSTGSLCTYDPATDTVTTLIDSTGLNGLEVFYDIVGIALDADGNFYLNVLFGGDSPNPGLLFLAAGLTTVAVQIGYGGNTSTYPYTVFDTLPNEEPSSSNTATSFGLQRPTAIHFSHDFTKLYIPSQWSSGGLGGQYGNNGTGMVIYLNISDGLYYSLAGIAVDLTSGGTTGYSFSPDTDLLTDASQGEGVAALGGMVGNVCDLAVHPVTGDIVTIANDVGMVRLIAADGSNIKSLSDHTANSSGSFSSTGYSGDGSAAFTTSSAAGAQFNAPTSVAFNKCLDVIIADTGNAVLRRIDNAGILSTVAGNGSYSPLPTSTAVLGTLAAVPANFLQTLADGSILIADTSNGNLYRLS